jgi:hypothetical protein
MLSVGASGPSNAAIHCVLLLFSHANFRAIEAQDANRQKEQKEMPDDCHIFILSRNNLPRYVSSIPTVHITAD